MGPAAQTGDFFCRLLITLANNFDPDQDQQNVGPDLGPNRLTLMKVFLKYCFEKVISRKVRRRQQKHKNKS